MTDTNPTTARRPSPNVEPEPANVATQAPASQHGADHTSEADRRREQRHLRSLESCWEQYAD